MDEQGFAWLPEDDFVNHFAADVGPVKARVMHAVQQPLAWSALEEVMGVPAWKSQPASARCSRISENSASSGVSIQVTATRTEPAAERSR